MGRKGDSKDSESNWISFFKYLVKIEFKTDAGKVNYRFGIVMFVISFFLLVKDSLIEIISTIIQAFSPSPNSILNENINVMLLLVLIFSFFIFCVLVISKSDKLREKIDKEIEST
ncbi:hypothetical protein [Anaerocolumna jejuensis]|uniref:hypothetical protein n=1 Tax=Anaerocolumna jejuensis TaxID=259063 RepID=UPI003F7CC610